MHKVIRITTNTNSMSELERALNDGYTIIDVSETHSDNQGIIIYVLKREK